MKVLGSLEALAGELAQHATDAELEEIAILDQQMSDGSNNMLSIDFFKTDMQFHTTIVAASRNESLDRHTSEIQRTALRARLSSRKIDARVTTLNQHNDITDALTRRDAKAAAEAMRIHIETAIGNLVMSDDGQETSS